MYVVVKGNRYFFLELFCTVSFNKILFDFNDKSIFYYVVKDKLEIFYFLR